MKRALVQTAVSNSRYKMILCLHICEPCHTIYGMKTAINTSHNFHIPLPEPVYQRLKSVAKKQHKPATQLAKQALEYWLDEQERRALHEEIASYAATVAGTADDLDEFLEAASLEHLNDRDFVP
jgi:predicted DNA-binding protein